MAHKNFNRVRGTATAPGTASFTLAASGSAAQSFGSRLASTNTVWYTATDNISRWEDGYGTFTAPNILARTTILESSNSDLVVDFSSGTVDVFMDPPASVFDALNLIEETVTCAATVDIGAAHAKFILLSGTTGPITSLGSVANKERWVKHSGETINNNASIVLQGGVNWATSSGDRSFFKSNSSGVYTEIIRVYANGATSLIDTDGTLAANSDTRLASQKAVKTYVDALLAAQDAMVFKGVIDCSANPNYPAADRGWSYRISVAGKIGGASGINVEAGDGVMCLTDGTASGTQAAVGAQWNILQANIDGAVIGPASATSGGFARFSGTTGKLLQNSAATVSLTADVSGTLPVANGGTGDTGTAWGAYTVNTPGAQGGALGAGGTYTGAYKQIGKTVFFRVELVITNIGTATGYLTFNAPVTAAGKNMPIAASNASNVNMNCNLGASSTTCYLLKYDGTSAIAVNTFYINGSYEAA